MADRAPINFDEFKAKIAAESGREITAGGKTFHIVPPELMTDEQYAAFTSTDDADLVGQARLMIDDYDGFVAAGGSAVLLGLLIGELQAEAAEGQGVDSGESPAS